VSEETDYVSRQYFIKDLLGNKRALIAIEISHLFRNIQTNAVGKALITGFSQVAKSKQVKQFMLNGNNIATSHVEAFSTILRGDGIPASVSWDVAVMNSSVAQFSDKLMLYHIVSLIASGIGNYGASFAASMRRDLQVLYPKLIAEVGDYAQDGASLMIGNAWMEQPPQIVNHKALVKV